MKFLIDKNVAYLGEMLRQFGLDAVSIMEIKREALKRNDTGIARMHLDSSIRRYAERNNMIIVTADWGLHWYCRKNGGPESFLIANQSITSKYEQILTILAHYEPEYFKKWLISGRWYLSKELKLGDGNWNDITFNKSPTGRLYLQLVKFDCLGYKRREEEK